MPLVLVNWSTIEGGLITYENIDLFIEYWNSSKLLEKKPYPAIINETDPKEKTILTLGAFDGRTEIFSAPKSGTNPIPKISKTIKTSGWIEEWIEYFFSNKISAADTKEKQKEVFQTYFPQLFATLQILENMV